MFGTLFRNLEAWKISISNTPIVEIDEHAFLGVNETLQELEINNSELNRFPKAFKVSNMNNIGCVLNAYCKIKNNKTKEKKKRVKRNIKQYFSCSLDFG